jgi:Polysaccharide lyase
VRSKLAFLLAVGVVTVVAIVALSDSTPSYAHRASIFVNFQNGLEEDFNLDGVGEVIPTVVGVGPAGGNKVARFALRGRDERSELILGRDAMGEEGTIRFYEGAEYWYGFSFDIVHMIYGHPGAHNLIMQFKSNGYGSPLFGLQLWDVYGRRGLWTAGTAMEKNHSGERFLAPLTERRWHHVRVWFRASEHGDGFYRVYLDGKLVDRRDRTTMIVSGENFAYIKTGLYRNGDQIPGKSVLLVDSAELGSGRPTSRPR